jgi:hypothetical protein
VIAKAEGVISAGALGVAANELLAIAPFSNTLPDVSAPGVQIRVGEGRERRRFDLHERHEHGDTTRGGGGSVVVAGSD